MSALRAGRGLSGEPSWDVIVVGCGAAGLSAAVTLVERSAAAGESLRVCVLERSSRQARGGSTAWTTSQFRLDTDYQLHPSVVESVVENAGSLANREYLDVFQSQVPDTLNFLR